MMGGLTISELELRVMAHLDTHAAKGKAFKQGLDLHSAAAARKCGKELDAVTEGERQKVKQIDFGLSYGISTYPCSLLGQVFSRAEA